MEYLLGAYAAIGIAILLVAIAVYVAQAIFLNKFNKLVNGKGTALAWIPICNIYLLGKLTVNKSVGWALVICMLLTGKYSTTINGVEKSYTILPEGISSIVSTIYGLVTLILFVYAIVKYIELKKNGSNIEQPMQPQYQQPVNQQYEQPMQPQYQQPVNQQYQQQVQPQYQQPVNQQYQQQVQPQYQQPVNQQYQQQMQPQYQQPVNQQYQQPAQPEQPSQNSNNNLQ